MHRLAMVLRRRFAIPGSNVCMSVLCLVSADGARLTGSRSPGPNVGDFEFGGPPVMSSPAGDAIAFGRETDDGGAIEPVSPLCRRNPGACSAEAAVRAGSRTGFDLIQDGTRPIASHFDGPGLEDPATCQRKL
jgi:hypothetical protein